MSFGISDKIKRWFNREDMQDAVPGPEGGGGGHNFSAKPPEYKSPALDSMFARIQGQQDQDFQKENRLDEAIDKKKSNLAATREPKRVNERIRHTGTAQRPFKPKSF